MNEYNIKNNNCNYYTNIANNEKLTIYCVLEYYKYIDDKVPLLLLTDTKTHTYTNAHITMVVLSNLYIPIHLALVFLMHAILIRK